MSELQFVEVDSEKITNDLITDFENVLNETLYPGDERRMFLQNFAPVLVSLKNLLNNIVNKNMLRYASGDVLTFMVEDWFGVNRLPAQKSNVTLRFTLSAVQSLNIAIPQGTRVTPDGVIFFVTKIDLIIIAGNTTGDVSADSIEAGEKYNGYSPGQVNIIVDPIPFVQSVSNIDTSSGGADIESDDNLRTRAQIAPESYSVAGPSGAYEFWAKTADSTISDIKVSSPSPGTVQIVVLQKDGQIPEQTILDKVSAIVSADDIRPLTDNVDVIAPTAATYNIDFTYYISQADQTQEAAIRSLIENSGGAVDQYKAWQCEKLGRGINPDELRKRVLNSGALRLTITSPTLATVNDNQVAQAGTVNVVYGGLV